MRPEPNEGTLRRKRPTRRIGVRLALVPLMLAVALAVAACGGDDGEGSGAAGSASGVATSGTGAPEQKQITFGILPTPDYAPVQIAIERGFFEEEGLDVTAQIISPGGAVPAVVGGSMQIAGINWISFLLAVNRNIDLQVVAEADRGTPGYAEFLVKKDSDIKGLEDLGGQKVGVVSTPGNCDVIPLDALQKQGAERKPEFVNLAIPDMPATIERGGVASACVPEPTLSAASADLRSVFDVFSGEYEGFPIVGYSTSGKFAEANPNTIGAVRRALAKASALINKDPDVVREILPTYTKITPEQAATITLPTYPEELDVERIREVAALMERIKLVEGKVDVPLAVPDAG
jgi:NitT/TauT family transport system substrate-binding protein